MKKEAAGERPTISPICYEDVPTHFPSHLFRRHKDNKEVIAIQSLEQRSKERLALVDERKRNEIKDLKKLIEGHWCNEISSLALKTLKEKHWEKPVQLPLNSDRATARYLSNRKSGQDFPFTGKGKGKEFKGKSLKDIEIDADVNYTTGSEKKNEGSDYGQPLSEKILKRIAKRPRQPNAECGENTVPFL
ncbi:hypothetical protein JTB14_035747 [Gonioctena quinquepunctata]|nr:hypothetical protein JTB14_035747 [Gonioctena quinquepunctata]